MRSRRVNFATLATFAALLTLLALSPPAGNAAPTDGVSAERLAALVKRLSGPEFSGRATPGDREKTAMALSDELRAAGTTPPPGRDDFLVHVPLHEGRLALTNVVAWVAGREPAEHVLVAAHFDHRGLGDGKGCLGADAATGAAALVELARAVAKGERLRRPVLFVAFDLAEDGQHGSRAYADAPPAALDACVAVVALDRLGRSLADSFPGLLLVHGTERAEGLAAPASANPPAGITLRRIGLDLHGFSIPDTIPFEERRIPSLLLTAGWTRDDRTPADTADKIDVAALAGRTCVALSIVRAIADAPARPVWIADPAARMGEVEDLLAIAKREGEVEDRLGLSPGARRMRRAFEARLEAIVARGAVTAGERVALRIAALEAFQGMVPQAR